ncbi:MAG: autorepressor SdpR family transcription factor [Gemmatimonadaceae bacterium]
MSQVFKALADPTRRKVLQLLQQRPMTAGELAEHFDVSKPTMSAHFAVLVNADLIAAEKHGRSITYRLRMSVLEEALLGFADVFGLAVTRKQPESAVAPPRAHHP